ncbi:hydroxyisourate hydrolase [Pseudomonas sp. gcc21]|uniref:hydroxyisourate hydrolase n=1 Tax=Pseudomonas sp. gcc21 TaxID=2726989 RepID=UPI0014515DAE|nr:hydroxyisourate hydrolase [Pseudomonas sp. gcc21]QJD57479.1 hydroxyisourate hydrolase [Pseudomonas sp. gcc21]
MSKSPLTTHILDLGSGRPAADVCIVLERQSESGWEQIASAKTNQDGRVTDGFAGTFSAGVYRLTFDTEGYFRAQGKECFYPSVSISFRIDDPAAHYHVPLLLNQWGYSTYRGS